MALALMLFAIACGDASAEPTVQPLVLPEGTTINPYGAQVTSHAGIVAATFTNANQLPRVALWRNGSLETIPIDTRFDNGMPNSESVGALLPNGALFVNAGYAFSGAYSGTRLHIFVYRGRNHDEFVPACTLQGMPGDPQVEAADSTRLAISYENPENFDFDNLDPVLPNAAIVAFKKCTVIGRFAIRGIRGDYAVGFRTYVRGTPAPLNYDTDWQTSVAIRWSGHQIHELGQGRAFAVSLDGTCVGAAYLEYEHVVNDQIYGIPSAAVWRMDGSRILIAPQSPRSIAYSIDDRHRVIGMLEDKNGHHFAFVWRDGVLKRLDDIVQAPRWRFESAYAFTDDGGIVGIGTHDGVAMAYIVRT
jgi:hypothetical protein